MFDLDGGKIEFEEVRYSQLGRMLIFIHERSILETKWIMEKI